MLDCDYMMTDNSNYEITAQIRQEFTTDLGQSLWGHFIIRNPKFGCLLAWDLQKSQIILLTP